MSNQVYANNMEVSCKQAAGKSICAFPDVCMTPPQTPATPPGVPIPYPNTGMASDTSDGSTSVKISNQEVMLKNKSCFKKSTGDEAGAAPMKGVVTHKNTGKVYFTAWSMDVKVEGENVVRMMDMTTHNHGSSPGNSPPWAYTDEIGTSPISDCKTMADNANTACKGKGTKKAQCKDKACREAKRCLLVTYNQGKRKSNSSRTGCCKGEQPHHLVEAHCFYKVGERGSASNLFFKAPPGKSEYRDTESPCVCAAGPRHKKEHGKYHAFQQKIEAAHHAQNGGWTYKDARQAGVDAQSAINPQCDPACTQAQLDGYHKDRCGLDEDTPLRTDKDAGTRSVGDLDATEASALQKSLDKLTGTGSSGGSL
jgi:Domain of unknown function (DUF4150)/GHH signature containing HNH/Endo VII superfamily nuclease toxin  2